MNPKSPESATEGKAKAILSVELKPDALCTCGKPAIARLIDPSTFDEVTPCRKHLSSDLCAIVGRG